MPFFPPLPSPPCSCAFTLYPNMSRASSATYPSSVLIAVVAFFVAFAGFDGQARVGVHGLSLHKTHLIDHVSFPETGYVNYLFRSDEPVLKKNYSFEYSKLMDFFTLRASQQNVSFNASDVFTTDICTLNNLTFNEAFDIEAENKFFDTNPQLGSVLNWMLVGNLLDPNNLSEKERKSLIPDYVSKDPDQLVYRLEHVREWLTTDPSKARPSPTQGKNWVFFVHCEAGSDRTGEFSAGYVMRHMNYTLAQALSWDAKIAKRPIEWLSRNAVLWYCWYLTYDRQFTHLNCTDLGPQ